MCYFLFLNYTNGEYHLNDLSRKSENNPKLVPVITNGFIKKLYRVKLKHLTELKRTKAVAELIVLIAETAHKGDSPDSAYFWHVITPLLPVFAANPTSNVIIGIIVILIFFFIVLWGQISYLINVFFELFNPKLSQQR